MRIKLLDRLRDGSATVHELTEALGASQQNVSKHLGVLLQAGMVAPRQARHLARYAIADPDCLRPLRTGLRRTSAGRPSSSTPSCRGR